MYSSKEKEREWRRRYYAKNKEKFKEKNIKRRGYYKQWYEKNKERSKASARAWLIENREKRRLYARAYWHKWKNTPAGTKYKKERSKWSPEKRDRGLKAVSLLQDGYVRGLICREHGIRSAFVTQAMVNAKRLYLRNMRFLLEIKRGNSE